MITLAQKRLVSAKASLIGAQIKHDVASYNLKEAKRIYKDAQDTLANDCRKRQP